MSVYSKENRNRDTTEPGRNRLVGKLIDLLEKGVSVTGDTLFFVESTFGLGPEDLEEALCDHDFEGREMCLDLIFSPGRDLRFEIEKYLAVDSDQPVKEAFVADRVVQGLDRVYLRLEGTGSGFWLPIENTFISGLVKKLHVNRVPDGDIIVRLTGKLPEETVLRARIMLRCSGYELTPGKKRFVLHFIERWDKRWGVFEEFFDMVLTLLAELPEGISIPTFLHNRKQQLVKTICDIKEFERRRDRYGMEYLLMERYQIPAESEETVLKKLQKLMRLVDDILGLEPPPGCWNGPRTFGGFGSEADVEDLLRLLS